MLTSTNPFAHAVAILTGGAHGWATPGELAVALDPKTVQTPALDLIDDELVRLANTPDGRLLISMPPQEGKSQRATRRFPEWILTRKPDTRIAIISNGQSLANRFGRIIRDDIGAHPELGLTVRGDVSAQHEWQLAGHEGGVYAVGLGGSLTGRPVDLEIIDDPVKDREQADSVTYRERAWDWWLEVGATRLAPGAPVVVIATRWHEDDLLGRMLTAEDGHLWRVVNIPAQADHRPDDGQTDPLGREPGEFMVSARGRTTEQWQAIKVSRGARTWGALYQGHPSPQEGSILHRDWWAYYEQPMHVMRDDGVCWVPGDMELIQSWDMAFKGTDHSDFVVGQVWGRRGVQAFLLDQVCERFNFTETCMAVRAMSARWPQASLKLVEDKANGPAVMTQLALQVPGLVPEEPNGSKEARAAAVSPFVEAGNVVLPAPELAPWVGGFVEQAATFPAAAHDDMVDAATQALNRLLLQPFYTGGQLVEDTTDDDMSISLY